MPFNDLYRRQVALLIRTIPFISRETDFALKGQTPATLYLTTINLAELWAGY